MPVGGRRFRFAPTPSRPLHVGNGLAALLGWAAAKAVNGTFILRVEDIDRGRCRPEHETSMLEDLRWLGIEWDEGPGVGGPHGPYRQSERFPLYDAHLEDLRRERAGYICTCSRADVRRAQSAPTPEQIHADLPYPGTCRVEDDPPGDHRGYDPDRGGLRLHVERSGEHAVVQWDDGWLGPAVEDVRATCGDFLLGRPGAPTYQLAAVVDDIAMGITDVVRGRDLVGSTARQLLLYGALDVPSPRFAHHPLLLDPLSGEKLSKREASVTMASLRERGEKPGTLIARLGAAIGLFSGSTQSAHAQDVRDAIEDAYPRWHDGEWAP